jgi:hypothetical protein
MEEVLTPIFVEKIRTFFEPLWDVVIRAKKLTNFRPMLESLLGGFRFHPSRYSHKVSFQECKTGDWE